MRKSLTVVVFAIALSACAPKKKAAPPVAPEIATVPAECVRNAAVFPADCEPTSDGDHILCRNVIVAIKCVKYPTKLPAK